jgi:hypothetical protein
MHIGREVTMAEIIEHSPVDAWRGITAAGALSGEMDMGFQTVIGR